MYVDPEAYKKDPEWQRLDKKARNARKLLYVLFAITLAAFIVSVIAVLI